MKNKPADFYLLLLVLLTGIVLRFWNYSGWSLSNDELSAMARLQFPDFSTMIREGVKLNDMHPPGVQVFLWFYTHIFGNAVPLYRLPFVLAGCLSIFVFYRIGYLWFGRWPALVSTAVFSSLSYLVLYSQLARPYSPGLLFALTFVYAWTQLLIRNERTAAKPLLWHKILFVLSGAACMYSHYFSFMFAGIAGLAGFFFLRSRQEVFEYLGYGIFMVSLFLPGLPVALHQFSIGGLGGPEGWLGPPKRDAIPQFLYYAFNESFLLIGIVILLFLAGLRTRHTAQENKLRIVALLFAMVPVLIAYYYSIIVNPVFQYSIVIFGFPFLLLFALSGFRPVNFKIAAGVTVVILIVAVSTMTLGQKHYSKAQFAVFKEIAELTKSYSDEYGNDNIVRTINVISPFYIHYYLDQLAPGLNYSQYKCTDAAEFRQLDELAKNSKAEYFLVAWTNTWHAPETEQIIRSVYPYEVQNDSFFNAGLKVFSKKGSGDQLLMSALDTINSFETDLWNNDNKLRKTGVGRDSGGGMLVTPETEYSSGIEIKAADAFLQEGRTIETEVWVTAEALNRDAMVVVSVENPNGKVFWHSRTLADFVLPGSGWKQVFFSYKIREQISKDDLLKVYIWNAGKNQFVADDFRIRVF